MDFLKLMVFSIFNLYPLRRSILPHSTTMLPFGSVTTKLTGYSLDWHCIRLGFSQNLVLPEPEPPTIYTFLFLACFGFLGRLDMVRLSVCVSITLLLKRGSTKGRMSSDFPQRAEPYSIPFRYFLASLPLR